MRNNIDEGAWRELAITEHKPLISEIGEHQRQSYFMAQGLEKQKPAQGTYRKNPVQGKQRKWYSCLTEFITKIAAYKAVRKPSISIVLSYLRSSKELWNE